MDSPVSDETRARAVMRARLTKALIDSGANFSARDAAVLLEHKLIHESTDSKIKVARAGLVKIGVDAQIASGIGGPLIFCSGDGGSSRSVFRVHDLLCDEDETVRAETLRSLTWTSKLPGTMCPATEVAWRARMSQASSEKNARWRRDAVRLWDVLDRDWLFSVAGLRQSLDAEFHQGSNEYLNKSLQPHSAVLRSGVKAAMPRDNGGQASGRSVTDLTTSEVSLAIAIDRYMADWGHAPQPFDRSLGSIVTARVRLDSEAWDTLWPLASASPSLLTRYHACEAVLANPSLIPKDRVPAFAEVIWDIVLWAKRDDNRPDRAAWRLLQHLARYFICHLELRAPISDGEALTGLAWWMSDRLVQTLVERGAECDRLLEDIQSQVTTGSQFAWEIVQPQYGPSIFRTMTLNAVSPWGTSLVSRMGDGQQLRQLLAAQPAEGVERRKALLSLGVQMQAHSPPTTGTYAFEAFGKHMTDLADVFESDGERAMFRAWGPEGSMSICNDLPGLLEAIRRNVAPLSMWAAAALSARAKSGQIDSALLWTTLSGKEWRESVWPALEPDVAQHVLEAAIEIAVQARPDWVPELPHLIAAQIERCLTEGKDVDLLFALTIRASCALHVGSALRRLMRNPEGHRLRRSVAGFRSNALIAASYGGMWASGHIRATLIDLVP